MYRYMIVCLFMIVFLVLLVKYIQIVKELNTPRYVVYFEPTIKEITDAMKYHGIEKIEINVNDQDFGFIRDGKMCLLFNEGFLTKKEK